MLSAAREKFLDPMEFGAANQSVGSKPKKAAGNGLLAEPAPDGWYNLTNPHPQGELPTSSAQITRTIRKVVCSRME